MHTHSHTNIRQSNERTNGRKIVWIFIDIPCDFFLFLIEFNFYVWFLFLFAHYFLRLHTDTDKDKDRILSCHISAISVVYVALDLDSFWFKA